MRWVGQYIGRVVRLGLLLWICSFAFVVLASALWPISPPIGRTADAIVCLGSGLSASGRADGASARRALTCAELYARGAAPVVVFTGYGTETISVASAMANLAIEAGLPPEVAIREDAAQSTIQNAAYALALLPPGTARVIVVSDAFHLPRSWVIFRIIGLDDVSVYPTSQPAVASSAAQMRLAATSALRESLAIWFNAGRLVVYGISGLAGVDQQTRFDWFN